MGVQAKGGGHPHLAMSSGVRIVEVGPRDGLQNIADHVATEVKIELIRRLVDAGLRTVEATSIVSQKAVPQLSDCREVLGSDPVQAILGNPRMRVPVLVPNLRGLETASQYGVREVAVFVSATEGFSKANINCTVEEAISRASSVAYAAGEWNMTVRG